MTNYARILHCNFKQHMFLIFVRIASLSYGLLGNKNKTWYSLHTILSIKDSLHPHILFIGNIFRNKCCRCTTTAFVSKDVANKMNMLLQSTLLDFFQTFVVATHFAILHIEPLLTMPRWSFCCGFSLFAHR